MLKRAMPPLHPGEILKELYMNTLGIGVTELADNLKVARKTISLIVNGHSGISVEMALRLSVAFNTTPELWLNLQRSYDLWNASKTIILTDIKHLVPANKNRNISIAKR
jgi:addiction module HigA family antidote